MASIWAENSYCQRRKVGALIVKDKMIISDGYNGTPSGFENVCEDENNLTKPYVLHAEANAITKIARSNNSSDGATMYVTASPCIECAKLIIQAGIKRVVYSEHYRLEDGIELLKRAGIEVIYTDKAGAETLNLVATGRADAAGEYEYVINSAIKDRGLPLKAVGDVLAVVPTYFLSKRTDDMKQVNEKIDKTMKEMRADGTLKKLSEQYLGGDYTFDPTQK